MEGRTVKFQVDAGFLVDTLCFNDVDEASDFVELYSYEVDNMEQ